MVTERPYVIHSEEEAWRVLAGALSGEVRTLSHTPIEFEGWPHFVVRVNGEKPSSSISPSMMEGLVELQKAIYRTHALYRYESADIRFLPDDEKDLLEFSVQVSGGSSSYDVDLQEILMRLVLEVAPKMEPVHIITLVLGGTLLLVGRTVWLAWINSRAEQRREERRSSEMLSALGTIKALSDDDTDRMRVLAEALTRQEKLQTVQAEADEVRQELLKGIGGSKDGEIQGIHVPGPTARELTRGTRSQSVETRVDGVFQILVVDATSPEGFRVKLRNDETGETFTASLQDALLSWEQRKTIQDAEWRKKLIKAKINASRLRKELVNAVIIDVEPVDSQLEERFQK